MTTEYTAEDAEWDRPFTESDDAHLDTTTAHPDDEEGE